MNVFILLIVFQVKHFIADYPLQGKYMLGKFKDKGWVLPLAAHAGVHVLFTLAISLALVDPIKALAIALFDGLIHFVMDRIKASSRLLGRFKPLTKSEYIAAEYNEVQSALKSNRMFWHSIGIDQMVHHLTHYACIYMLLAGSK